MCLRGRPRGQGRPQGLSRWQTPSQKEQTFFLQCSFLKERDSKVVALRIPSKLSRCSNHVLKENQKGTPFRRYIMKAIEQTSKFTENITKNRQKKLTVDA